MGESSKMELPHPKVAASSAGTLRRCVNHIAEGGRSERDPRDEGSGPALSVSDAFRWSRGLLSGLLEGLVCPAAWALPGTGRPDSAALESHGAV